MGPVVSGWPHFSITKYEQEQFFSFFIFYSVSYYPHGHYRRFVCHCHGDSPESGY